MNEEDLKAKIGAVIVANVLHVNVWLLVIALLFTVARVNINVSKK